MNLLNNEEIRIIGSLIEKEITTPEYYPLTVNSLKNACNQKSNREPVVSYDEELIQTSVDALRERRMVRRVTGSDMRVAKYRQTFTEEMNLTSPQVAAITVLMLRGPQTLGEIKGRSSRLYAFENLIEVEDTLKELSARDEPLVAKLPRKTGMKEARYAHLLNGETEITEEDKSEEMVQPVNNERIDLLAEEISSLKNEITSLKEEFEKFKKQFD